MPAAVASAPHPHLPTGPMARTSQDASPRSTYQNLAPGGTEHHYRKNSTSLVLGEQPGPQAQPQDVSPTSKRTSPNTLRPGPPKIVVKKEPPSSPEQPVTKHRPRKLDLTHSTGRMNGPATAAPNLGMQDVGIACLSPGFQTQDPAMRDQLARSMSVRDAQRALIEQRLQKNNPGGAKGGERTNNEDHLDLPPPGVLKGPPTSKKRGPPPGLSIVAPSAQQFANERVIQSAPLHQTFTGRDAPPPHLMQQRQNNGVPAFGNGSNLHNVPTVQTNNRLPPIGDVFGGMGVSGHPHSSPPPGQPGAPPARPGLFQSHSSNTLTTQRPTVPAPPFPSSPSFPPPGSSSSNQQLQPQLQPQSQPQPQPSVPPPPINTRPREYRSAEEAVADLTKGREDLQPRLVHYMGAQPPTPPSPQPGQPLTAKHAHYASLSASAGHAAVGYPQPPHSATFAPTSTAMAGPPPVTSGAGPAGGSRRRPRSEYERDNGSPPLGSGPSPRGHRGAEYAHQAAHGYGPFGAGRDSPATQRAKKDEFMACVALAWDLWHS